MEISIYEYIKYIDTRNKYAKSKTIKYNNNTNKNRSSRINNSNKLKLIEFWPKAANKTEQTDQDTNTNYAQIVIKITLSIDE